LENIKDNEIDIFQRMLYIHHDTHVRWYQGSWYYSQAQNLDSQQTINILINFKTYLSAGPKAF